jgi:N-acyl-D-aspartate/D-glutamate deacylase
MRGRICGGRVFWCLFSHSDVTLLINPKEISDMATFANPHQYAKGMLYVIVNGVLTVEQGEHAGAGAGTVLRRR